MVERRGSRSPSPAGTDGDRQRQRIALLWLGGLVLAALGLWLVVMLSSQGTGGQPPSDLTIDAGVDPDGSEGPETDEPDDAGAAAAEPEDDGEDAGDADDPDETAGAADAGMTSITFDGECTVEVPADEETAAGQRRAWEFDECTYAPVAIEGRTERWIVVRASMPADAFGAADADERAGELGADGGVLWSSHYPSLTDGLWVVFDGPFPDADAARDAAATAGGGAYVRALTAD